MRILAGICAQFAYYTATDVHSLQGYFAGIFIGLTVMYSIEAITR